MGVSLWLETGKFAFGRMFDVDMSLHWVGVCLGIWVVV